MYVNSASPAVVGAQSATTRNPAQVDNSFADLLGQFAGPASANSSNSTQSNSSPSKGLPPLRTVSGLEVSLPNGMTVGVFKFEEGSASGDDANGATSTDSGQTGASVDSSMVSALEQFIAAFGYGPDASAMQSAAPANPPSDASKTAIA